MVATTWEHLFWRITIMCVSYTTFNEIRHRVVCEIWNQEENELRTPARCWEDGERFEELLSLLATEPPLRIKPTSNPPFTLTATSNYWCWRLMPLLLSAFCWYYCCCYCYCRCCWCCCRRCCRRCRSWHETETGRQTRQAFIQSVEEKAGHWAGVSRRTSKRPPSASRDR